MTEITETDHQSLPRQLVILLGGTGRFGHLDIWNTEIILSLQHNGFHLKSEQ